MPKVINPENRAWIHEDVVGHAIDRCKLWYDGHGVSFSLVNMPAGNVLSPHRHQTWVAVFMVKGSITVEADGVVQKAEEGSYYFVEPGEVHVETALEDVTVLVIKAEPNIQYQVDAAGNPKG